MTAPTVLPTLAHKAHRTTIELLKEMLEEAELGNLVEVIIIGFGPDMATTIVQSPTLHYNARVGALAQAQYALMRSHDEAVDRDEEPMR